MDKSNTSLLKVYCDGGARGNPGPSAGAFVVVAGSKVIHRESRFLGTETNNVAEYSAVIDAFSWLVKNKGYAKNGVLFYLDSELIVKQLSGLYKVKSSNLKPLVVRVKKLEKELGKKVSYISVPRDKNKLADALVNKCLDEVLSK